MNDLEQIIEGGYCIGCGACAESIPISMNAYGMYEAGRDAAASLSEESLAKTLQVCPFSNNGPNEDELGARMFGENCSHDSRLGYHRDLWVGHVAEGDYREKGTSGGVISWVLVELLRLGRIDAVVHVKKVVDPADGVLFRYGVSRTKDEIRQGAKSRYYPVEMSEVLRQIKAVSGRYAVVGLPCFIKAVRRLAETDPVINERVVFCVGLVCGHLKSKSFADCFGWQAGISPGELQEIDFRVKLQARSARDYGVCLRGAGREVVKPTRELFGSNWGHNFFRYSACDYCDDVFAETADVAVGDAWLPEYIKECAGNSIVVVRNITIHDLIEFAVGECRLDLIVLDAERIAESQAGGLRDRREGLAYRLFLKQQMGEWAPNKRVKPSGDIQAKRKKIYQIRSTLAANTKTLWQQAVNLGDFEVFRSGMRKKTKRLDYCYRPLCRRALQKMKRQLLRLRIK